MVEQLIRRWYEKKSGTRSDKKYISSGELRVLVSSHLKGKLSRNFGLDIADTQYY